jgi:hypothetical protein
MLVANDIVKLWEAAKGKPYWQKAILLLSAAHPNVILNEFASLSIGQRNAKLFRFRESLFGAHLEANSSCPTCKEKVEFQLDSRVICDPNVPVWDGTEIKLESDNNLIVCRPPSSHELEKIMPFLEMGDEEDAAFELMKNCVLQLQLDGIYTPVESMPLALIELVSAKIKDVDSHSEILCRLNCPECEFSWAESFDIVSFLWLEIENKAHVILSEVQLLAKAFGWWEGDTLSLSDVRRKYYIDQLHE